MITVRTAIVEDADAIECLTVEVQQLHREALPGIFKFPSDKLFSREKLATVLQDANSTVAVAESKGEIIGYAYGVTLHRPENDFKKAEKELDIILPSVIFRLGIPT